MNDPLPRLLPRSRPSIHPDPSAAPAGASRRPAVLARRRTPAVLDEAEVEFVRRTFRGTPRHPVHRVRCCSACGSEVDYSPR